MFLMTFAAAALIVASLVLTLLINPSGYQD
jgi:hypothetical protein